MRNFPVEALNASDAQTQTGEAFFTGQWGQGSFVPTFGDVSATGTVKIQASNYPAPKGTDPSQFQPATDTFSDIPNATSAISSGVGPAIVLSATPYLYMRVVYTRSGGGTTTVVVRGCGLGI